ARRGIRPRRVEPGRRPPPRGAPAALRRPGPRRGRGQARSRHRHRRRRRPRPLHRAPRRPRHRLHLRRRPRRPRARPVHPRRPRVRGRRRRDRGPLPPVATDARRKEVYWARYEDPRTRVGEPAVDRPADIAEQVAGLPAVGQGATLYPDVFPDARGPVHQSAASLAALAAARLAAGEAFLPPTPLYLRRPDAQVPKNYKVVTPQ
ncbi:LOW QUALITY PROTEIN: rim protein, partial [Streptomyces sp. C]